ncbi:MAG: carboxypeptidase-like regulatory domain-containing protein, partial [Terracidiphilus sp.]
MTAGPVSSSVNKSLQLNPALLNTIHCLVARLCRPVLRAAKAFLLLALLAMIPLRAQQPAPPRTVFTGIVRTSTGQPISSATVTVSSPGENQKPLTAVTSADGRFSITGV